MPECRLCHAETDRCYAVHSSLRGAENCFSPRCARCASVDRALERRDEETLPIPADPPVDRARPMCACGNVDVQERTPRYEGIPLFQCPECNAGERRMLRATCPECDTVSSIIERLDTRTWWCLHCDRGLRNCDNCGNLLRADVEDCPHCGESHRSGRRFSSEGFEGEPSAVFPRYLGVEIECGGNNDRPPREWFSRLGTEGEIDDDGSVSMEAWSMEFKPIPSRGDTFAQRITRLGAMFREVGVEVNRSCGLHVHVDARDFTSSDVLKLVRLNAKIESALYGVVSRSRRSNHFSLPWRDRLVSPAVVSTAPTTIRETIARRAEVDPTGDDPQEVRAMAVESNLYGSTEQAARFKRSPYKGGERYHGLNLTALPLLGTVEFRHHQGTVNPHKIMMWAALCSAVIEYAKNHTEEEIVRVRGTPAECLDKILRGEHLAPVRAWVRRRRAFFSAEEHGRPVPRGRAAPVEPPEPLDISTEREDSEAGEIGRRGRIGRPSHAHRQPEF